MGLKHFAILALGLALSGCYVSERPLITADNADYPFKGETAYREIPMQGGLRAPPGAEGHLTLTNKHYIRTETDLKDVADVMFKKIDGDYYAAQQQTGGKGKYYYDLVHIDGKILEMFGLDCSDTDQAKYAKSSDVRISSQSGSAECVFTSFDGLKRILLEKKSSPDLKVAHRYTAE